MSSPPVQGGVRLVSVWSQARAGAGAALEEPVLFWCVRRASLGGFQVTPCGSSHPPRLPLSKREKMGEFKGDFCRRHLFSFSCRGLGAPRP